MVKSNIKKEFNCNIEKLWDVITDNTKYAWRSDLSKIEIIDDSNFIEFTTNNYPTYFTITSKKKLKEYKFDIENANIKGKWIGIFKKLDNGNVLLDFTEEIETNNLIMKILAKPYLKSMQKRYMRDLEQEVNK
ncbi:MAG: SRPBCC family protein [Clostridium sp.]|nr:SRPBCC family protein [Clostridium sp.]MCM1444087.1 SRPBCC family protein [Candidatus Amulumruptor caecigallinarius]